MKSLEAVRRIENCNCMNIEIECSLKDAALLFDGEALIQGMTRDVPAGSMRLALHDRRPGVYAELFPLSIFFTLAKDFSVNILANLVYDKLKSHKGARVWINRKLIKITTPEAIIEVMTETKEIG
jgi:hypothetical protein